MMSEFKRGLNDELIKLLAKESEKNGWWRDVLADSKLLIGIRDEYLQVYWHGQSLFTAKAVNGQLKVTTHEKYLLDPKLESQVELSDGHFKVAHLVEKGFTKKYGGTATLQNMKTVADYFSGIEKPGCHEIATRNDTFLDCEIAFPGFTSSEDGIENEKGRVDIACVESSGDDVRLVFWEVKHYSNKELRSDLRNNKLAPVCGQIKKYRNYISQHRKLVLDSYTRVAHNLVALQAMRAKHELSPLIIDVGTGKRCLVLDEDPKIGLMIFGFDEAQPDHARWTKHLVRLRDNISPSPVVAVGNAKDVKL